MTTYCAIQLVGPNGIEHTIASFPAIVGKARGVDVRITGCPTVSRVHARLLHDENMFAVEDLGSTNKTYVQGYEVKPGFPVILSDGDMICFADEAYRVHLVAYDSQTSTLLRDTGTFGSWTRGLFR